MAAARSISGTAGAVRAGDASAIALVTESLDAIDAANAELNAFRETYRERALREAAGIDRAVADGLDPGSLAGVPVAIKDNLVTAYGRTSCGSRMLEAYESPFTATAVRRLEAAGAIIVGKTTCDEFGMGSSTEHCAFGAAANPWDVARVPGGSSGGSAAAVAARLCPVALGSDTGGSIRQPAALCGIVGVKPTYGRVSRYGLVAYGSSLDQVGPFATTVADAAHLLQAIAGPDEHDSTSAEIDVPDYLAALEAPIDGLRIGVAPQFTRDDNDPAVTAAVESAIDVFRSLGATIVNVDLPLTDHAISTYYVIAPAEASSNLARYDGVRYGRRATLQEGEDLFDLYARSRAEGFGPEVRRRVMLGTYVLSAGYYDAYYTRAQRVRRLIKEEFETAFESCHAVIGPTAPTPAFRRGEKAEPLSMYLCDLYTAGANISGHCAISLPAGFADADGAALPVGVQLQCRAFDEATMFRIGRMFEAATNHHERRPPPGGSEDVSTMHFIGVDLGGTNMQIGVVDSRGSILASRRQKTRADEGRDVVIDRMIKGITRACGEADLAIEEIDAFGVAAPGAIDMPRGVVLEAPNLGWSDTPLRDILQERLRRPVVLENDVNAAAWGEHRFGAGRGTDDLLGVWMGTGVGGGLILDGRIHHGPLFTAGEIGQTIAIIDAPKRRRTVEDLCSRSGLSRIIEDRLHDYPDSILHEITGGTGRITGSKKLARAVQANDPLAVEVVDRAAVVLGTAIANWVTVLAIDRVIIGGGLAEALGVPLLHDIRTRFDREVFPARSRECDIRITELMDDSGLLGAADLARAQVEG